MRFRTASQSTAANRKEIRKMQKIVDEQQRVKIAMEPQELETMQINLMKRKKGMFLVVFHVRVRLQRLSELSMSSPTGRTGSGVSFAFEAEQ